MLSTTDAIVLSLQPHSDKAHVLHAYTRAGGRINYMVYGLGRKNPIGLYTPLSLIRITASCPPNGVPAVKEACFSPCISQPSTFISDPYKRTIALFISEVLHNVLRHPMPDDPMFDFLIQAIEELDCTEQPQNFHVLFMMGFAEKLGFAMERTPSLPHSREERQMTLRTLCAYFAEHVETWQNPKSLDILMEVFD